MDFLRFGVDVHGFFVILVPMLWIAGIGAGLYFTVGFASWVPVVALIAGLVISRIMINNRRETLMQNGLRTVLDEPS